MTTNETIQPTQTPKKTVGILIFNEVELLDFAGPFEVFSLADGGSENKEADQVFNVVTIAQYPTTIFARNGMQVVPDYHFGNHPKLDVLVVPGGYGAQFIALHNPEVVAWILAQAQQVELTLSVCTGAFLLAQAGLLDGKSATTHWQRIATLTQQFPAIEVQSNVRYVDASDAEMNLVTAAGISAGIEASLYCVSKLTSPAIANASAKRMEYDFQI